MSGEGTMRQSKYLEIDNVIGKLSAEIFLHEILLKEIRTGEKSPETDTSINKEIKKNPSFEEFYNELASRIGVEIERLQKIRESIKQILF